METFEQFKGAGAITPPEQPWQHRATAVAQSLTDPAHHTSQSSLNGEHL